VSFSVEGSEAKATYAGKRWHRVFDCELVYVLVRQCLRVDAVHQTLGVTCGYVFG